MSITRAAGNLLLSYSEHAEARSLKRHEAWENRKAQARAERERREALREGAKIIKAQSEQAFTEAALALGQMVLAQREAEAQANAEAEAKAQAEVSSPTIEVTATEAVA